MIKLITNPIIAKIKFILFLGSMKIGSVASPVGPKTTLFTPAIPQIIPPSSPLERAKRKGFFNFRFTPYIAGSVIPNNAVKPEEADIYLKSLSLETSAIASAAPACPIFATKNPGPIISNPFALIAVITNGIVTT